MSVRDREMAKDKAAQLLRKRGSLSSATSSNEFALRKHGQKHGSMSTISFIDEPGQESYRPAVKFENTYQIAPLKKFPRIEVQNIIQEVLDSYLASEKYEPDLCRNMTKTISDVVKGRVKDLLTPRYKVICIIHIGQLLDQGMRVGSRCLWDASADTFASYEFKNNSLFAIGSVYGIYFE